MRTTTTTALAVGATALAIPAGHAEAAQGPLAAAIHDPVGGHLTLGAQMRADARALAHKRTHIRLVKRVTALAARRARATGRDLSRHRYKRRLHDDPAARLRAHARDLRRDLGRAEAPATAAPTAGAAAPGNLQAIASCESGGDPTADTGNGFYGKYQFTESTWASVGGTGNPAAASEAEQDERAAMLYAREGATPWPVCGR